MIFYLPSPKYSVKSLVLDCLKMNYAIDVINYAFGNKNGFWKQACYTFVVWGLNGNELLGQTPQPF